MTTGLSVLLSPFQERTNAKEIDQEELEEEGEIDQEEVDEEGEIEDEEGESLGAGVVAYEEEAEESDSSLSSLDSSRAAKN